MANAINSVLALSGNKVAALAAAQSDIALAATRTILHGDRALFDSTADALAAAGGETKGGVLAKGIKGEVLAYFKAAGLAAINARAAAYPSGRAGKASDEQTASASATAETIAAAFVAGMTAAAAARQAATETAKAENKVKKEAAEKEAEQAKALAAEQAEKEAAAIAARTVALPDNIQPWVINGESSGLIVDGHVYLFADMQAYVAERAKVAARDKVADKSLPPALKKQAS